MVYLQVIVLSKFLRRCFQVFPLATTAHLAMSNPGFVVNGSSLFSVELELWEAELAGDEIKHGGEVGEGAIAAGLAFGGAEHAV